MTSITFTALLACAMALLVSIGALCAACLLWRRCRSTSYGQLLRELTDLSSTVEELTLAHRNHRAAANMRARRAAKALSPESGTVSDTAPPQDREKVKAELRRSMILKNGR